jgi:hypothetical protein
MFAVVQKNGSPVQVIPIHCSFVNAICYISAEDIEKKLLQIPLVNTNH